MKNYFKKNCLCNVGSAHSYSYVSYHIHNFANPQTTNVKTFPTLLQERIYYLKHNNNSQLPSYCFKLSKQNIHFKS